MMKLFLSILIFICLSLTSVAQTPTTADVWFNEFHYDGVTTYGQSDQNEFIEIAIRTGIATNATELAKYKVVLYTAGAADADILASGRGLPYNVSSTWYSLAETEFALNTFTQAPVAGTGFSILVKTLPILQDVPAGFALIYNNTVIQLLSYEKQFQISNTPSAGAAAGLATTLILDNGGGPAQETALTPTTHSISLIGTGNAYSQFVWEDLITQTATPGVPNSGQTFVGGVLPVKWLEYAAGGSDNNILLRWKVGEENDVVKYEVELNDGSSYRKVAQVNKRSENNGSYMHTISQLNAGTYTVRIKAIEHNKHHYSEERKVKLGSNNSSLIVYPNPAKNGQVNMQVVVSEQNDYTALLIDANGRILKQQVYSSLQKNVIHKIAINLQGVAPGRYQLKLRGKNEEFNTSIVVMQ